MMLLVYPAMADTAAPTTGVVQAAPVAEAAPAAPTAEATQAQRAVLEQRVTAKWDALIRKDFSTAYSFTSPEYRKLYSLDVFKGGFGNKVTWRRVEVVNVEFKGDNAATVGIKIYFVYHPPQAERALDMQTYVQEPWVLVDGQWWYLVKR
jgi:hypothetical protein